MAAEEPKPRLWDGVLEMTKAALEKGTDSLVWAMELSAILNSAGATVPSVEVAGLLVSHICWSNNIPLAWKYLEKALSIRLVSPMFVLALLSARVIPCRWKHPEAYRLYIELVRRYAFSLPSLINGPNYQRTMTSISDVLQFSQVYGFESSEPGFLVVEFVFSIVWKLLDSSLDDEGLMELTSEKKSRWPIHSQDMDIDFVDNIDGKRLEHKAAMSKTNTVLALEVFGEFLQDRITCRILYLARRNMPTHWNIFRQNVRVLASNSSSLRSSKNISPEEILNLTSDTRQVLSRDCKTNSLKHFHAATAMPPLPSSAHWRGTLHSALWLPIDLYLEDAMDGSQIRATSSAVTLAGLLKSLQALNQTSWQDSFLGMWTAVLRLVQRESNSSEGPVPRLDTCLCMLLSIATLAVVNLIEEEETIIRAEAPQSLTGQRKSIESMGKRRENLVSSLKCLGDFEGLLTPPPPVCTLANQAYAKAVLHTNKNANIGHFDNLSLNDLPLNCSGTLWHLIVEACIARNLLDTSAYLWPGYVKKDLGNNIPRTISGQVPSWSSLISGSPLNPQMVSVLESTPANSLAEIERIYEIAISGSDDEKISAATVLCGASLSRGWNIQERTVFLIIRLLAPEIPQNFAGSESHLIGYAPFLNVLLAGISSVDCIQIFSLHGLVPQLAAALMPICEVFGSCAPNMSWSLNTGEVITSHAVFSNAFTLLLKLWRFYRPPVDSGMGDATPAAFRLSPDYLLLIHNLHQALNENPMGNHNNIVELSKQPYPSSRGTIVMDSFPKLKRWHMKNQECIVSTLSGLVPGDPVHQIVESLLSMMFRKMKKETPTTLPNSGKNSSSASASVSGTDDSSLCLKLPAWNILEAVPFVLDAALTACAHGQVSPRELTTGLKDLADFLPASLATIVSYFSAEVTRGLWKPASMNGTDWPSPAANLFMVEQQIKKIVAATGVNVPGLPVGGNSPVTLPLPLAAFVSLTITFKLDRGVDRRYLNLVGHALSNLGISCPWPCMPILAALWSQKAKRWSDYLVFSASQTVFYHSNDAVVQLLRVCFSTVLGLNSSSVASSGGAGALLGHGFGSHHACGLSAVAPGILYLRVHRAIRDIVYVTEKIVSLLIETVKDITSSALPPEKLEKLGKTKYASKYGHVSLATAMSQVKLAASLGASLIWLSGGMSSVQSLIKEILPSWFISVHELNPSSKEPRGVLPMLGGYALAYFTVFSAMFAWGVDAATPASKHRRKFLGEHLEFLASAIDGKISLGCSKATWRAYVTGYLSLMVSCAPGWMQEVDAEVVKRVSKGLKQWNEEELAIAILGISGIGAMGTAAEMIIVAGF